MSKEIIAEISLEGSRLFLIHRRKGIEVSKTDVTAVWHFFKEFQTTLSEPKDS